MARRQNESLLEVLVQLPWWVSVLTAAIVYFTLAHVVPHLSFQSPVLNALTLTAPRFAVVFGILFLLLTPISILNAARKRRILDSQSSIETIKSLPWRQFEELVAEYYRRRGFQVQENIGGGPDGGIDIKLQKGGETHLVQCKQWRSQKVGVPVVREMFGIMHAENATSVAIVTAGKFTPEAIAFSRNKPILLIDGPALYTMVSSVQESTQVSRNNPRPALIEIEKSTAEECPRCGSALVLRVSKKGKNFGSRFYGCGAYPKCRFTKNVDRRAAPD